MSKSGLSQVTNWKVLDKCSCTKITMFGPIFKYNCPLAADFAQLNSKTKIQADNSKSEIQVEDEEATEMASLGALLIPCKGKWYREI